MKNNRLKRHKRIRRKISGTTSLPRVAVFRSNKHLQVQLIDDTKNITLVGLSTASMKSEKGTKLEKAKKLGAEFGKLISGKKVETIVYDRGGYKYHGRVKAVAEGIRESGIKF